MATKVDKIAFGGKKKEIAEALANPDLKETVTDLCVRVGVARSTFYKWLDDEDYREYIQKLINKYADSELAGIWKALISKCKTGDVQAIKLYFELKDRYRNVDNKELPRLYEALKET